MVILVHLENLFLGITIQQAYSDTHTQQFRTDFSIHTSCSWKFQDYNSQHNAVFLPLNKFVCVEA